MHRIIIVVLLTGLGMMSCQENRQTLDKESMGEEFRNQAHRMVYEMVQKVGSYHDLLDRKDVVYTYTYRTPDGREDVSLEKYLFDGELSYGLYTKHQRTLPEVDGHLEQAFDGSEYWMVANGQMITDSAQLRRVAFTRPTNFYWFAMFPKLLDPGLNYDYLGEKVIDSVQYHVVKITFESPDNKPTDIYQIYINQESLLVDQFLFTVADYGKIEVPFLMQVEYEEMDGLLIPSIRKYKESTWNADINDKPWTHVNWSDISFNRGLKKEDFLYHAQ